MRHAHPLFAADLALVGGVEEVRHHGPLIERGFVFLQRLHFRVANSAVAQGVIVLVAVGFLDNHFVL